MKKSLKPLRIALALAFAVVLFEGAKGLSWAETVKKLHPSVQYILKNVNFNDATDATTGVTSTVDLSGGDLDKVSFGIYVTSSVGTGFLTYQLQISPDGGTTWLSNYSITQSSTNQTAQATYYANIPVAPGTKMRMVPTLTGSSTWYAVKIWAMPSVD